MQSIKINIWSMGDAYDDIQGRGDNLSAVGGRWIHVHFVDFRHALHAFVPVLCSAAAVGGAGMEYLPAFRGRAGRDFTAFSEDSWNEIKFFKK